MLYDRNEERRRRALIERQEATAKLKEKLADLQRKERSARSQLLETTTRHPNWHAHRLAYQDRQAGYTGEMAEARYWVRALTLDRYVQAISPFADAMPGAAVIMVEVAAVRAHLDDWTRRGKELLYEQARAKYEVECAAFETWRETNPDQEDWRDAPVTRDQWMLIRRTVDRLDSVAMPVNLKRGEAHDWLQRHGANLRFRGSQLAQVTPEPDASGADGGDAADDSGEGVA